MLDELKQRIYETKNRLLDLQLEESFDNGREIILLKILKRFKDKTVRTLPKNIQKELIEFKNLIESRKKEKNDFSSPYTETVIPKKNKENKKIGKDKNNEFEKISINDLLKDYEETTQEIKKQSYKKLIGTIFISFIPLIMMLSPYLKKPIKLSTIYLKDLFYLLFVQLNNFL